MIYLENSIPSYLLVTALVFFLVFCFALRDMNKIMKDAELETKLGITEADDELMKLHLANQAAKQSTVAVNRSNPDNYNDPHEKPHGLHLVASNEVDSK